ncbi:MAG: putative glycoside hydrolase, partial [Minisyncoccia bacterium]
YEVIKYSIEKATGKRVELERARKEENPEAEIKLAKIRPWLQAFDMGAVYGPAKIKAEIRASNEAGGVGWILWNASNNYSAKISGIND